MTLLFSSLQSELIQAKGARLQEQVQPRALGNVFIFRVVVYSPFFTF
jgi:hypothetical protein